MADPAGTKTEEAAKKNGTEPDPARETDLVVPDTWRIPEEAKENKTTGCVIPPKDVLEGPKEIENPTVVCPKILETAWRSACFIILFITLFRRFMMVQDLLDPCFAQFRSYSQNWCTLAKPLFFGLGSMWEVAGTHYEPRIRFYRLVGRVRTLRVPARRSSEL